jgi:hypothetical protein
MAILAPVLLATPTFPLFLGCHWYHAAKSNFGETLTDLKLEAP